jgi:hypothetical protein
LAEPELTNVIVKAFAHVARPYILQWFPEPNSCIAACRITVEVLARFGIHSWPLSVRMKAEVKERSVACGLGLTPEELAKAKANPKHRRFGSRSRGWPGHLIVATEHHWIIDPTFDTVFAAFRQLGYNVQERSIMLAVNTETEPDPLGFAMNADFSLDDGNKLDVLYLSSPDEDYRQAPAWETDHLQPVIRQICEAICRLGGAPVIRPASTTAGQTQSPD